MVHNCLLRLSFCQVALKGENSSFKIEFKKIFNLNSAHNDPQFCSKYANVTVHYAYSSTWSSINSYAEV